MRNLFYAATALAMLGAATMSAHADSQHKRELGATAGAATGAMAGAVIGGPVGAAVGGVAGAIIGSATAVPEEARTYVVRHPVSSVEIPGHLSAGYVIPRHVTIREIPSSPNYGYVYVDGRPVIVRMSSREVVYAGPAQTTGSITVSQPPQKVITYIRRHPVHAVQLDRHLRRGVVVPHSVELTPIPDDPQYAYIYVQGEPVLVERHSRRVVWVH